MTNINKSFKSLAIQEDIYHQDNSVKPKTSQSLYHQDNSIKPKTSDPNQHCHHYHHHRLDHQHAEEEHPYPYMGAEHPHGFTSTR